ncbi:MAG: hypothetical protein M3443_12415 [Actinomycetota bacterium]|nr:hypothetical protein [Actinomycetota bacterium]
MTTQPHSKPGVSHHDPTATAPLNHIHAHDAAHMAHTLDFYLTLGYDVASAADGWVRLGIGDTHLVITTTAVTELRDSDATRLGS